MRTLRLLPLCLAVLLCACDSTPPTTTDHREAANGGPKTLEITPVTIDLTDAANPAAPGFDLAGSDKKAILVADSIVKHHGGRAAYDAARFFRWDFFGARTLTWDKQESRVRIDVPKQNMVYLLNYGGKELTGRVRQKGDEIVQPDSLAKYLQRANSMLINDSYWLVHQFKLKDSGVTLKYVGEVRTDPQANRPSHIIDLTFKEVGDTPNNRYRLYVDKVNFRINTWQFFRNAEDEAPAIETPWKEYLPYQGLLLSGDRGGRFQLNDISVTNTLPERTFTEF
ncbi:MAG: hypothetical protein AAGF89_03125 [Bacteroidota bacterium]